MCCVVELSVVLASRCYRGQAGRFLWDRLSEVPSVLPRFLALLPR